MLEGERFEVGDPWDHLVIGNFDDVAGFDLDVKNTASKVGDSSGSGVVIGVALVVLALLGALL